MVKRVLAIFLTLSMMLLLAACGPSSNTDNNPSSSTSSTGSGMTVEDFLAAGITKNTIQSVATGTSGGTQYVFMSAIGNVINSQVNNLSWNMESSTGGIDNLNQIRAGNFELGFAEQSTANDFYQGAGEVPEPYTGLRAVFPCYTQDFLFSTVDPNLTSPLTDFSVLNGKTSGCGSVTGSVGASLSRLSEIYDLSQIDFQYVTWGECFGMMAEGSFDYIFGIFGQPSSQISEYNVNSANPTLRHIELSDEIIDAVVERFPFYSRVTLPASMYTSFNGQDYHTYGCWAFVYCDKNMDNLTAYEICKALFSNLDDLSLTLQSFSRLSAEDVTNSIIPLQTGAIWYYEEAGIEIPAELYPEEYISMADYVASLN